MIFSEMSKKVDSIIDSIHDLPFNRELAEGTLSKEKFIFYLTQDALYLADFSRALALIAARIPNNQHTQQFIQFALEVIQAERDLHFNYLDKTQFSAISPYEQSPACFMYTNYLLKMASLAPVEVSVAGILPCFWVYREVGRHIAVSNKDNSTNPYADWIKLYSSEQFDRAVVTAIDITNELAKDSSESRQKHMINAFVRSTQLEWLFWQGAYQQEKWPI